MLGYNQSKQAGDGAPVAFSGPGHSVSLPMPPGAANDAAEPVLHDDPERQPMVFNVQYSVSEYSGFMWEHGGYLIRRRKLGFLRTHMMLLKTTGSAALHFAAAGRSKLIYEFTIDDHGIVRSCARGVTLIAWDDVIRIRRYRRGYLMVLKRGTLPIPYRCLGQREVAGMERYAEMLKLAAQRAVPM
ncbi:MAG: YcxB family protein [Telluria sp.]